MLVPVTTVLERIRDATDSNDDGEEGFVTNNMLLRWLNAAIPRFEMMMMRAGWVLDYTAMSIEANGSTDGYSSDGLGGGDKMMCIFGCWELISPTNVRQLRSVHPFETPFAVPGTRAHGYFANDSGDDGATKIFLRPNPQTGLYSVLYKPEPSPVDIDGDINYPNGWEEWLVLECARQVTGREESRNVIIEDRKLEIEREVERMASDRLFAQGPRVRDVRNENFDPSVFLTDPTYWYWL